MVNLTLLQNVMEKRRRQGNRIGVIVDEAAGHLEKVGDFFFAVKALFSQMGNLGESVGVANEIQIRFLLVPPVFIQQTF